MIRRIYWYIYLVDLYGKGDALYVRLMSNCVYLYEHTLFPRILRARKRAIPGFMSFEPPRFYTDRQGVPSTLSFFRFMTQLALAIKNAGLVEIAPSSCARSLDKSVTNVYVL